MTRKFLLGVFLLLVTGLTGPAFATAPRFMPGAAGAGDPYFPLDGNGGYDVQHYRLEVQYDPSSDQLVGLTTLTARATQDLSSFNLDLDGLEVSSVTVDGVAAAWSRDEGELTITPSRGLRKDARFVTVIAYGGVPVSLPDLFGSGFIATDDGALVLGEPHVASTWFPANDHPTDHASFTFAITVPEGLEVVANGVLEGQRSLDGWTTWVWHAKAPMATYLAGVVIGQLALSSYEQDGIRYWDAIDADFVTPIASPATGTTFMISGQADLSYKRLSRLISVPAEGAALSFSITRDTELDWDFFFVEAHTAGSDDWTTLPDVDGIATQDTGFVCPFWHAIHPFLEHYQTAPLVEGEPCVASGTSGEWWAATGASAGAERWTIDLSAYAGRDVEVSLSYASDDVVQSTGVFIDDVVVSTGQGSTSFEDDADALDGWAVPGPPEGSPGNESDWLIGTVADVPLSLIGEIARASFARQPEIIAFLADLFGPYPFDVAGAIVPGVELGFALENQTRPIYSPLFFRDAVGGASVIVHELTHQWFGDSLRVEAWQHVWLNEGFATYAEWLWAEHEGFGSAQERFDALLQIDAADPFWSLTIGDPGPDALFDFTVYQRGAGTLHALRAAVGDAAFFEILQSWACSQAGDTVTTDELIDLAEQISGRDLRALFDAWLFTPGKPSL